VTENESRKKDKEIDPVTIEMEDQTTWFSATEKGSLQYCQQHSTLLYFTSNPVVQNTTSLSILTIRAECNPYRLQIEDRTKGAGYGIYCPFGFSLVFHLMPHNLT
jgi:hypothetical protein